MKTSNLTYFVTSLPCTDKMPEVIIGYPRLISMGLERGTKGDMPLPESEFSASGKLNLPFMFVHVSYKAALFM
jgi:hypothetical protein